MKRLLASSVSASAKTKGWPWPAPHAGPAALVVPARRGIFESFWRPKPGVDAPPAAPYASSNYNKLWGAKTGVGSLNPPPDRALEDLVRKLERAHHCTQQLKQASASPATAAVASSGQGADFPIVPAYVPVGLDAPVPHAPCGKQGRGRPHAHQHRHQRIVEEAEEDEAAVAASKATHTSHAHLQEHLEDLIHQHFCFRLRRLPSTVPGAGLGLFVTSGKVKEGAVLTCYPGLIYRIPYDLEREMEVDDVLLTPVPPAWLVKNDYLLRFHHEPTDQHLLLDGCPRGMSALNFIKASQRRACLGANMDWLESTAKACGLRPTHYHEKEGRAHPGSDYLTATAAGGGKGFVLLPAGAEAADPRKYFSASLGMGHMINDPGDPSAHNAEFHLCELPPDVPPHLLRYLPNLNYSDALGDRRYAVIVTAARDMEVSKGGPPIELFVPYNQQASCRRGFPLL